jgi:hypothetical protein
MPRKFACQQGHCKEVKCSSRFAYRRHLLRWHQKDLICVQDGSRYGSDKLVMLEWDDCQHKLKKFVGKREPSSSIARPATKVNTAANCSRMCASLVQSRLRGKGLLNAHLQCTAWMRPLPVTSRWVKFSHRTRSHGNSTVQSRRA